MDVSFSNANSFGEYSFFYLYLVFSKSMGIIIVSFSVECSVKFDFLVDPMFGDYC